MNDSPAEEIPVIDVFAGAGGLGEGFSSSRKPGAPRFVVKLSIECDDAAHLTLELRAFFHMFPEGEAPEEYYRHLQGKLTREELFSAFPAEASEASRRTWKTRLGETDQSRVELDRRITEAVGNNSNWVLVGGPPCQAYSLAGRSRNRGKPGYRAEDDHRHFLYKEYLRILRDHRPAMYVMENVKGMLSAKVSGESIFNRMIDDLKCPDRAFGGTQAGLGYRIYSLSSKSPGFDLFGDWDTSTPDFVVESEKYGIPQRRHRVLLLGVRQDIPFDPDVLVEAKCSPTVSDVIGDLPKLRAELSSRGARSAEVHLDSGSSWRHLLESALLAEWMQGKPGDSEAFVRTRQKIADVVQDLKVPKRGIGAEFVPRNGRRFCTRDTQWFHDPRLEGVCNHSARKHMASDFHRYLWASCYASVNGMSPRLADFPKKLWPKHKNVGAALSHDNFSDRFKVQLRDAPATTVMSHIAKDGHYYIHYDPSQCRSLTVREAARLQTFPDNYLFCGNRTEQYTQVGNAVPPLLARQIAEIVRNVLMRARSLNDRSHLNRAAKPQHAADPTAQHASGTGGKKAGSQTGAPIQAA